MSSLDWSKKAGTPDHWFWEITKKKGKKGRFGLNSPSPYPHLFFFFLIFLWFLWSKNQPQKNIGVKQVQDDTIYELILNSSYLVILFIRNTQINAHFEEEEMFVDSYAYKTSTRLRKIFNNNTPIICKFYKRISTMCNQLYAQVNTRQTI